MRCERCQGTGQLTDLQLATVYYLGEYLPNRFCPDCHGVGVRHCCDGENVDRAAASGTRPIKDAAQQEQEKAK